ncbi:hypothetical protein BT93_E1575 [Corymbia citriodora subsp. variegata]|nr:hypothetical protein BT93_E1575 [Corymbia citriodora subsp. variegata]
MALITSSAPASSFPRLVSVRFVNHAFPLSSGIGFSIRFHATSQTYPCRLKPGPRLSCMYRSPLRELSSPSSCFSSSFDCYIRVQRLFRLPCHMMSFEAANSMCSSKGLVFLYDTVI